MTAKWFNSLDTNSRSLYCRLNCSVQIWVQKRNLRFLHQSTISDGQVCSTFTVAKGKEISQGNLGAFNFPKKQQKHLPNFCPSIEEVVKSKNMQTIFYTNYGLFNIMKCPYFLLRPFFSLGKFFRFLFRKIEDSKIALWNFLTFNRFNY